MNLQQIYHKLPVLLQNLGISMYGYYLKKNRYGKIYYEYLAFLEEYEKLTLDEKREVQFNKLKELLHYAKENSKFYSQLYKNINLEDIKSLDDIKKLPIITKEMIRNNIDEVRTIDVKDAIVAQTGGTTGKSMKVFYTKNDFQIRMATLDFFKFRYGFYNIKMKRASFGGRDLVSRENSNKNIFWRYNSAIKQRLYSSYYINEENLKYYVKDLNKFKPQAIDGFFSSIYEIASYIKRNNIELKFIPVAIFPTSETITQREKDIIEEVFKCKVINQYASSEGAPFITECKMGNLHYELHSGIFEYIDDNSDEVLITSFTTHGTPLIRYKIGDSIENLNNNKICNCGCNNPIVSNILGRSTDFLYAYDGTKVTQVNIATAFKYAPKTIKKAQIIQYKKEEIIVKLVVDRNEYNNLDIKKLISELKLRLGKEIKIQIKEVKNIPREKSGKHRFIINELVK